jgi:hypothetical protein
MTGGVHVINVFNWTLAFVASGIILWVDMNRRGRRFWSALGILLVAILTAGARTAETPTHDLSLWPMVGAILPPLFLQLHVLITRVRRIVNTKKGTLVTYDTGAFEAVDMTGEERRIIASVRWITAAASFWFTLMGVQAVLAFEGYAATW